MHYTVNLAPSGGYDPGLDVADPDAMCLHRNENLFLDSRWQAALLASALGEVNLAKYPSASELEIRRAIADYHAVDPDSVIIGCGADGILSLLLQALRKTYNAVVALKYSYRLFPSMAAKYGYRMDIVPGGLDPSFNLHDALDGRIESDAIVYIDSPNGVTGVRLDYRGLEAIASNAKSFLIWDNTYGDYANDEFVASLRSQNVAVVRSFSKFYGLASLRIGYCLLHNSELIAAMRQLRDVYAVSGPAMHCALHALRNRRLFESWNARMQGAKLVLESELRRKGLTLSDSRANFVCAIAPASLMDAFGRSLASSKIHVRSLGGPDWSMLRITVPPTEQIAAITGALPDEGSTMVDGVFIKPPD